MVHTLKLLAIAVCFVAMPIYSAWAQEDTKTVSTEGVAEIKGNAKDTARDSALEDAQKRAVEEAIAILIDSRTRAENYQLIRDKILSQFKAYIKRYNVTGESTDSGLLRVRINAEIALGKLTDDLAGIGILLYSREAGSTRSINITIDGLNKTQFIKFKDVLRNQVRDIKDLHERSFIGSTARISVDSKVSSQALSDDLSNWDFGTFGVEVVGLTANSLELKVKPKQ